MKKASKCPKCGAKSWYVGLDIEFYRCDSKLSLGKERDILSQANHCKERVKVAKLKKHVAALRQNRDEWEAEAMRLMKELATVRNPNF